MKKVFFLILIGAVIIIFVNNWTNNGSTDHDRKNPAINHSANKTPTLSDNDRLVIRNLFLSWMDSVVKKTKDSEAKRISDFVKKNNVLAAPDPSGARFIEGASGNKNWFMIVPFCEQDGRLSDYWSGLVTASSFASNFLPEKRALLIKTTYGMSNIWKGITIIHEGFHALTFISNPYESQTDDEYAAEEMKAHTIQNRIMSELGGKKYAKLLNQEKIKLKARIASHNLKLGTVFPARDKNYPELDEFFGKTESDFETNYRGTSFWMHVVFELIDDNFKADASKVKINFLKGLYQSGGIR